MSTQIKVPLAVHFIWNHADSEQIEILLTEIRKQFARDVDYPFSRSLNIPLFFYSSENCMTIPESPPLNLAAMNVIFVFTSKNTVGIDSWSKYIETLPTGGDVNIIGVALDKYGLQHKTIAGASEKNSIRFFDQTGRFKELHWMIALAHEIYRFGCNVIDPECCGKSSSLKLFLSHSKSDEFGKAIVARTCDFIHLTNMRKFFDATDISPGFDFEEEIKRHGQDSTMIVFSTDRYSSRYWCQREMLLAKGHHRPMIVVDCMEEYEDRIFPAKVNVPCIHVPTTLALTDETVLKILLLAILETIRLDYSEKLLKYYQKVGWINRQCKLYARPPEVLYIKKPKDQQIKEICYPDPPVYQEESQWFHDCGIEIYTPLMNWNEKNLLQDHAVGISVSEVPYGSFSNHHQHSNTLKRFSQDVARLILSRAGILIYGGDLRDNGFTEFILDEALILADRLKSKDIHIENHLAWPIYKQRKMGEWKANYNKVIRTVKYPIPEDIADYVCKDTPVKPDTSQNKYIWSRTLTEMRVMSIERSNSRICAGGKLTGYLGKMPGVLEEIMIALEKEKPLYLLGGFGGVVGEVCSTIKNKSITEPLTEKWQQENNPGHASLQILAMEKGHGADYGSIQTVLEQVEVKDLAERSGLQVEEYQLLMSSPFVDECLFLVLKGLKNIRAK